LRVFAAAELEEGAALEAKRATTGALIEYALRRSTLLRSARRASESRLTTLSMSVARWGTSF